MRAISRGRLTGGAVLSAVAFGLAVIALGTAGSANASCASVNGHNIGQGCESTVGSVSVGLGRDARADSAGLGSVAIAVGNPGYSRFYESDHPTLAYAHGTGNVSVALGNGSLAGTLGNGNRAFVLGRGSNAFSYGGNIASPFGSNHNTSIALGNKSEAGAVGPARKLSTAFGNNKQLQNNGLNQAPQG
jgi:hypothetical protein